MKSQEKKEAGSAREEIDRLVMGGESRRAQSLLRELWKRDPGPKTAGFVVSRFERLRPTLAVRPCRIAILRSFTVEPVVPVLRAAAMVNGIDPVVWVGSFNAYAQEILDEKSSLYSFAPDIAILAVQTRDAAPKLWHAFTELFPAEVREVAGSVTESFERLVQAFRSRSKAHLVLHSFEQPSFNSHGVLDSQAEISQGETIWQINRELRRLSQKHPGLYFLDYDGLVARSGRQNWHDERKWLTSRMPITAEHLIDLANEWMRFIHPLTGKICKALVTDLDNTLWGGVIGEDGMGGIQVGAEYPGAAYLALQRVILDLYQRGIILAVCSKNNPAEAMEAIEHHPGMLLRPHHFAALRINWKDKASNLREIAQELNIGIDTLAFMDDSLIEREWICVNLSEVTIIDLPDDPMLYAETLRRSAVFERLSLTGEDRERGRYYAEERLRTELRDGVYSLQDFYRSLMMEVEISSPTVETVARIAQLTQKTNQFNVTTRRYSEQEIAGLARSREWGVCAIRLRDKFGDSGLVGVAISHYRNATCEIDTFLMSCRVIGRTVETAFLASIAEHAIARGAKRLIGRFIPTRANAMARELYPSHGFTCASEGDDGLCWEFDLTRGAILWPEWIKRRFIEGD
jgi:FkbH-like protein